MSEARATVARGTPESPAAQAYCGNCGMTFTGEFSGAVLDVQYEHAGERHRKLVPAHDVALSCPSCGAICRVTNLLTTEVPGGAVTTFGTSAEELQQAQDLADFMAAHAAISWADAADEIERRAPWLKRLADEMRAKPLEATGVVGGLGLGLAALLLQISAAAQGDDPGITAEQLERFVKEIHKLPAATADPPTAAKP